MASFRGRKVQLVTEPFNADNNDFGFVEYGEADFGCGGVSF